MNSLLWFRLALLVAVISVTLSLLQLAWRSVRDNRRVASRVQQRLLPPTRGGGNGSARVTLGPLERFLVQADIQLTRRQAVLLLLTALALLALTGYLQGLVVECVALFFVLSAGVVYWRVRFQRQRRIIFEELPGIVDAVLRSVDAGRSLEHGLVNAFDDASPVFAPLVFRLRSAVDSGREYTRLFEDFAAIYRIPPLIMVSIALRTSTRFGSSIRPVLVQVAASLRAQQEMRREFLAATAETRFTAITFAVLPPGLALYMVTINEKYSQVLLETSTGHGMLMLAGALQLIGMALIWRLIQGVGRE
ncbi:MAG: type II secretion system F family protein [Pseudomonadales bacterium]|nr:type II secretion system F family protein [Pseudomonadales bacterium]